MMTERPGGRPRRGEAMGKNRGDERPEPLRRPGSSNLHRTDCDARTAIAIPQSLRPRAMAVPGSEGTPVEAPLATGVPAEVALHRMPAPSATVGARAAVTGGQARLASQPAPRRSGGRT